jgi:hypothetical protein
MRGKNTFLTSTNPDQVELARISSAFPPGILPAGVGPHDAAGFRFPFSADNECPRFSFGQSSQRGLDIRRPTPKENDLILFVSQTPTGKRVPWTDSSRRQSGWHQFWQKRAKTSWIRRLGKQVKKVKKSEMRPAHGSPTLPWQAASQLFVYFP